MKPELLPLLECPTSGSSLRIEGDNLVDGADGKYPIIQGMPRFYGLTTTDRPPAEPEQRESEKWSGWRRDCHDWLARHLEALSDGAVVLDLGAGPGQFAELTRRFQTVSTDFAPYQEIDFVTDLTKRLPIKTGSFDAVVLSNVLEHLPEPHVVVGEVFRVLKPGGVMIAMTPFMFKLHQTPYDFLRYTRFMFEYLFRQAGFERWEIQEMGHPRYVIGAIFKTWRVAVAERFGKEGRWMRGLCFNVLERLALGAIDGMQRLEKCPEKPRKKTKKERLQKIPQGYGTAAWKMP